MNKLCFDYATMTDQDLVGAIVLQNDEKAFDALYERYEGKVYGRCLMIMKDPVEAEDLMQEVMVKIFLKLKTFKGESKLSTWIYQVATNTCLHKIQKQKNSKEDFLEEPDLYQFVSGEADPFQALLEKNKKDLIQKTLEALNPAETVLILMKYADGLSMEDMADRLQIREGAAKVRLLRARKSFEIKFEALGGVLAQDEAEALEIKKRSETGNKDSYKHLSLATRSYFLPRKS